MTDEYRPAQMPSEDIEEPTVESMDDSLGTLERIKKYINSDLILHRLFLVREFTSAAKELGAEQAQSELLPLLTELANDVEPVVRQGVAEQIAEFFEFLSSSPSLDSNQAADIMLPFAVLLATDHTKSVRAAADSCLVHLANALPQAAVEKGIMPVVASLSCNSVDEEQRIEAAQLAHDLAPRLGADRCLSLVMPHMRELSSDKSFAVRKAVSGHLGAVCEAVGPEAAVSHVLPLFVMLSRDRIWDVRCACAETIATVAVAVPLAQRTQLAGIFERLHADESRWVRTAAQQQIGPMIVALRPDGPNTVLPDGQVEPVQPLVVDTTPTTAGDDSSDEELPTDRVRSHAAAFVAVRACHADMMRGDAEMRAYAAFVLPAVLLCSGKEYWPKMRDDYVRLANDPHWKVRLTLAHSLHEVAKIVGKEETEAHLVILFDQFLGDVDEVRNGVVRNMATFFRFVSKKTLARHERTMSDLQSDPISWRLRESVVEQMPAFVRLYPNRVVTRHLAPLLLRGLRDPVDRVCQSAALVVGSVLDRLAEIAKAESNDADDEDVLSFLESSSLEAGDDKPKQTKFRTALEAFLARIEEMATSVRFDSRLLFCVLCGFELKRRTAPSDSPYSTRFVPLLKLLLNDPVPNVRETALRVLKEMDLLD